MPTPSQILAESCRSAYEECFPPCRLGRLIADYIESDATSSMRSPKILRRKLRFPRALFTSNAPRPVRHLEIHDFIRDPMGKWDVLWILVLCMVTNTIISLLTNKPAYSENCTGDRLKMDEPDLLLSLRISSLPVWIC